MQSGWRIGSIFGIPLLLDSSWFFILALVTFNYASSWQGGAWSTTTAWIAGLVMALLLFGSVLLHELGHSLVALSQGISVSSITLFLFGGIASIDQESRTPGEAFQVAIAGPAVSFVLFLGLAALRHFLPADLPATHVASDLADINLVLALFNMIPGLPLDGGQVLKAAVWKVTGSRLRGVRWAARVGMWLGWGAIIFSLTIFLTTFNPFVLWIALLGWFGVRNAAAYSQVSDLQEALLHTDAGTAMTRDFRVVDPNLTVRAFTDNYLLLEEGRHPAFYAASDGRYRGMVELDELQAIDRSLWETETIQTVTQPLSEIPSVLEATSLAEVVERLEGEKLPRITVLTPAGAVGGVVDRGDVLRAVMAKLKVPVSDTFIKRIKDEGAYPPGLQLETIAKSARESVADEGA